MSASSPAKTDGNRGFHGHFTAEGGTKVRNAAIAKRRDSKWKQTANAIEVIKEKQLFQKQVDVALTLYNMFATAYNEASKKGELALVAFAKDDKMRKLGIAAGDQLNLCNDRGIPKIAALDIVGDAPAVVESRFRFE